MRLFHAYFNYSNIKYYHKDNSGKYIKIGGEYKYWELGFCIDEFGKLESSIEANLKFFIGLRNKIEHRHIDQKEIDILIFGECQSLLYNYESTLTDLFGEEYAINENLAYSLQFSLMRTREQKRSSKSVLSNELKNVKNYINNYRTSLSDEVFNSQEYSVKLMQVPKVSNTNRSDLAIEFVNWNSLSSTDKSNYDQLISIIKDKRILTEAVNTDRYKPIDVIKEVKKICNISINQHAHRCLYYAFSVRPTFLDSAVKEDTISKYCLYDSTHNDYVYTKEWVDFICNLFTMKGFSVNDVSRFFKERAKLDITKYE